MTKLDTVKSLIEDWKRKDVEAVLSHVADEIVYYYAVGEAPITSKSAMREFLGRLKGHQKDLDWNIKQSAETDNIVMIEGVDNYINPAGIQIQTPHMTTFEFTNEKISGWRDYFDFGILKKLEGGEAANEHFLSLVAHKSGT